MDPACDPPLADRLALVQRARAAGACVRVFAPEDPLGPFRPDRVFLAAPAPRDPSGYHPDQWPPAPPGDGWQMLLPTPAETAVRNAAVLKAARAVRESGLDDPRGSRELRILSRARRAELYLPLPAP